jgi:hypothetical protein
LKAKGSPSPESIAMEFNDGWLGVMHKHRQRSRVKSKKAKRIEKKTRIEEKHKMDDSLDQPEKHCRADI